MLTDLRNAVTVAESREAATRRNLDELRRLQDAGITDRYLVTALERQESSRQTEFDGMTRLLEHYQLRKSNDAAVRIATLAVPPPIRSGPHRLSAVMLGGVIGFVGSVIVSLFRGTLSGLYAAPDRYRDLVQAREVYALPALSRQIVRGAWRQIAKQDRSHPEFQHSGVSDIVRWLLAHQGGRGVTVTITSPTCGEGKTTISALLARSGAAMGLNTLLIDADIFTRMRFNELAQLNVVRDPGEETGSLSRICRIHETPVSGLLIGVAHEDTEPPQP